MNEIETAISGLERQKDVKLAEVNKLDAAILKLKELLVEVEPSRAPREFEYRGLGIADAAKRWMQEVGGTRTTRQIADAILARGVTTNSKNYTATVYAVLAAAEDFERQSNGTWKLKEG